MMNELNIEISRVILGYLNDEDLGNACIVNHKMYSKVCNDIFWINKISNKFGLRISEFKSILNNTYYGYYLNLVDWIDSFPDLEHLLINGAMVGRSDIIRIAIIRGVNINVNNSEALLAASQFGHVTSVKVLLDNGADANVDTRGLAWAGELGYIEIVKLLVDNKADINGSLHWAPLVQASRQGQLEVVTFLYDNGADININNNSSLEEASYNNKIDVIKFLLSKGADINANNGRALKSTGVCGGFETVKFLLDNGADVYLTDALSEITDTIMSFYDTDVSFYREKKKIIKLLIDRGANVEILLPEQKIFIGEMFRLF